jgi:hypothetical protein
MDSIIEYRDDRAPANEYPRRIVSPTVPSACCMQGMEQIGQPAFDAHWRFYYKRCSRCGYTVRCFYAPSLRAALEAARQIKLALAEMNLGTGRRKRRTQAEINQEIAAALGGLPAPARSPRSPRPPVPFRRRRPAPSPA